VSHYSTRQRKSCASCGYCAFQSPERTANDADYLPDNVVSAMVLRLDHSTQRQSLLQAYALTCFRSSVPGSGQKQIKSRLDVKMRKFQASKFQGVRGNSADSGKLPN
jgi:hypothetical protein